MTEEFWIGASTHGIFGTPSTALTPFWLSADGAGEMGPGVQVGESPMYLAWSDQQQLLLACHEAGHGYVSAWRRTADGLEKVGETRSNGSSGACYLSVTAGGWVASANYFGGELRVQPLTDEGVGESVHGVKYVGTGPNEERQEQSHPHQAYYDPARKQVLVPDLGADRVHRHTVDPRSGAISSLPDVVIRPGAGPRHVTTVGHHAVLVNELDGTLDVIDLDRGLVVSEPVYATEWDGPAGDVSGSAVRATSGDLILVGNRGPNSISVFHFDRATGRLEKLNETSTHGDHPRDFQLTADERHVVVANQASDTVTVLALDQNTGVLTFTGDTYPVDSPVAVLRIPNR